MACIFHFIFFNVCVLQIKRLTYLVLWLECVILQSSYQFIVKMTDQDSVPVLCKADDVS